MQNLMLRLDGVVRRRRWWIIAAWVLVLVAALPFAARQSDHLSSGGFSVPGSQSQLVNAALDRTPGAERATLAVVLVPTKDGTSEGLTAWLDRANQAARKVDHVALEPQALAAARRQAAGDAAHDRRPARARRRRGRLLRRRDRPARRARDRRRRRATASRPT